MKHWLFPLLLGAAVSAQALPPSKIPVKFSGKGMLLNLSSVGFEGLDLKVSKEALTRALIARNTAEQLAREKKQKLITGYANSHLERLERYTRKKSYLPFSYTIDRDTKYATLSMLSLIQYHIQDELLLEQETKLNQLFQSYKNLSMTDIQMGLGKFHAKNDGNELTLPSMDKILEWSKSTAPYAEQLENAKLALVLHRLQATIGYALPEELQVNVLPKNMYDNFTPQELFDKAYFLLTSKPTLVTNHKIERLRERTKSVIKGQVPLQSRINNRYELLNPEITQLILVDALFWTKTQVTDIPQATNLLRAFEVLCEHTWNTPENVRHLNTIQNKLRAALDPRMIEPKSAEEELTSRQRELKDKMKKLLDQPVENLLQTLES